VTAARKWLPVVLLLLASAPASSQTTPTPSADLSPSADEGGPTGAQSNVGYIDSALPTTQFRLRFDAGYDFQRPTRAEFFWARGGSPGVPLPETRVDYQDISSYLEVAFDPRLSLFVEGPYRFVNPQVNANANGFSDMNTGFKWAFIDVPDWTATFQFRTYIPTGDAARGLGNNHVSLEPALLAEYRFSEKLRLEGELRYWVPIGGTDFAGDIIRYGLGVSYGCRNPDGFWVTPVVEFVGWTVLGGKETVPVSPTLFVVQGAAGDTIVNGKLGLRFGFGTQTDVYAGYGRALTGATWYTDTFRVEFRLRF
jgi:hypothetical protein